MNTRTASNRTSPGDSGSLRRVSARVGRLVLTLTLLATLASAIVETTHRVEVTAPAVAAKAQPRSLPRATRQLPALRLAHNITPNPDFLNPCATSASASVCANLEVAAINNARGDENVAPLQLNVAEFTNLSPQQQIFVIINLERTARGLAPVLALDTQLNSIATRGVATSSDPKLNGWKLEDGSPVLGWASNWAGGLNVLGADYYWMYADGTGANIDCTTNTSAGCWGHRMNILLATSNGTSCASSTPGAPLAQPTMLMGAADNSTAFGGANGLAEITVLSCENPLHLTGFTWQVAEHLLLGTPLH